MHHAPFLARSETRRRVLVAALLLAGITVPTPMAAAQPAVTRITLGDQVTIEGNGANADAGNVQITAGGVYELSGTLDRGQVNVDAPQADVELILNGVDITSTNGPAILVREAGNATITLADGSRNRVEDGGDTDFDAAIAGDVSLTFGGDGALEVIGNQEEGIASTMDLTFTGGDYHIRAVEDGLNANNDGVSVITISGGSIYIETETGDGIDSNGALTITGGEVITQGAMEDMNGGLDADGAVTIDGGEVIATGARLSVPVADSTQQSLLLQFDRTQDANTLVVIQNSAGEDLLVFAPALPFRQLLFSDAGIAAGETYTYFTGGSGEGEAVNGRYTAASNPGTEVGTVTTASLDDARRRGPLGPPPDGMMPPPDGMMPPDGMVPPPDGMMSPVEPLQAATPAA